MAIARGARLGPYEIVSPLGAGGMGEVYRAADTKLGRPVAIKVLPAEVAGDAERLGRFRREAHLLASLNHPNIAAIHGLEESDGMPFLVLELVEGEDIAARLGRGPIPRDEALEIAKQITEALEEAHGKGVVHRDLKPANVKLTPDGRAKVLDFGLAKAYGGDGAAGTPSADISESPTLARSGTLAGLILGTAAYMSPEQASGKAVDRRTDIWSFGVVLFEMLTGRPLFTGETLSEVLATVIKEEPPWQRLPADCPPAIVKLLRRCLRKRVRERLQDIGDARLEISDVLAGAVEDSEPTKPGVEVGGRSRGRERWAWAMALSIAVAAALLGLPHFREHTEPGFPVHLVLDTPEGLSLGDFSVPAVSPNGRAVVFGGSNPGKGPLWIRLLGAADARPLPGTDGGRQPFWSPDGQSVAFFTEDSVKRVNLADGTVQRICGAPHPWMQSGSWDARGTILFAAGSASARIYAVSVTGGEAKALTNDDASRNEAHAWPQFLPDGRHFFVRIASSRPEANGLFVVPLDSPAERRRVLTTTARVLFAAPGHLLFVRAATLMAQPFDLDRLVAEGEATAIATSVASWSLLPDDGLFSASANGVLAYKSGGLDTQLVWRNRNGATVGTVGQPARYDQIALSPNGREVATEIIDDDGAKDLWVVDVARGVASRITADPVDQWDPVWSPDGRELIFCEGTQADFRHLFRKDLRGGGPKSMLLESPADKFPESWSPDGKTLFYGSGVPGKSKYTVWALSFEAGASPVLILDNGFNIDEPQISPDARWLAYITDESGQWEVYVQPVGRPGDRVRVSTAGGGQPKWRGDARELFYVSREGRLMAVAVKTATPSLEVGLPVALFDLAVRQPVLDDYAPSADGQRFLVKVPLSNEANRIHIVVNWPSLLTSGSGPKVR